jgi:two-component system, NtrC family, response regulator AtoC
MPDFLVFGQICDRAIGKVVQEAATDEGHRVQLFASCEEVLSKIRDEGAPDLLLLELSHSTDYEEQKYEALLAARPQIRTCLLVRPGDNVSRGLAGLKNVEVLTKPVLRRDLQNLIESMSLQGARVVTMVPKPSASAAAGTRAIGATLNQGEPLMEQLDEHRFFLAHCPAMLEIYRQVKLLQGIDVPILILGESGTGKEIIAHLIHKHSRRAQQRFVNVNCAALPMDLLESELFGHVKGAFTGAINDRPGRFEQAHGGTILLDEIGEISAAMQAKLLHVLQDGQFTRLGGRQPTRVDIHVLAATNISIEQALENKSFREDLYYRLNTFTINVPPLRERTMEIPYLVREMIMRAPIEQARGLREFSRELMELLPLYSWPGNLRELRNFVIRTMIMEDESAAKVELEIKIDLALRSKRSPSPAQFVPGAGPMRAVVRDIRDRTETRMIEEALHACGWNRRDAARCLNISYRALLYKIQQYGLHPKMQRMIS